MPVTLVYRFFSYDEDEEPETPGQLILQTSSPMKCRQHKCFEFFIGVNSKDICRLKTFRAICGVCMDPQIFLESCRLVQARRYGFEHKSDTATGPSMSCSAFSHTALISVARLSSFTSGAVQQNHIMSCRSMKRCFDIKSFARCSCKLWNTCRNGARCSYLSLIFRSNEHPGLRKLNTKERLTLSRAIDGALNLGSNMPLRLS